MNVFRGVTPLIVCRHWPAETHRSAFYDSPWLRGSLCTYSVLLGHTNKVSFILSTKNIKDQMEYSCWNLIYSCSSSTSTFICICSVSGSDLMVTLVAGSCFLPPAPGCLRAKMSTIRACSIGWWCLRWTRTLLDPIGVSFPQRQHLGGSLTF